MTYAFKIQGTFSVHAFTRIPGLPTGKETINPELAGILSQRTGNLLRKTSAVT